MERWRCEMKPLKKSSHAAILPHVDVKIKISVLRHSDYVTVCPQRICHVRQSDFVTGLTQRKCHIEVAHTCQDV